MLTLLTIKPLTCLPESVGHLKVELLVNHIPQSLLKKKILPFHCSFLGKFLTTMSCLKIWYKVGITIAHSFEHFLSIPVYLPFSFTMQSVSFPLTYSCGALHQPIKSLNNSKIQNSASFSMRFELL